jgi:hypothetical protein
MAITFKDVLKMKLADEVEAGNLSFYGPAVQDFLARWLEHEAANPVWDQIAAAHAGRARQEIFARIIDIACIALDASDPQHGFALHQIGRQKRSRTYEHAGARRMFAEYVVSQIHLTFRKPYHGAVVVMTDLAFPGKPTTEDEVAQIWSRWRKRKPDNSSRK